MINLADQVTKANNGDVAAKRELYKRALEGAQRDVAENVARIAHDPANPITPDELTLVMASYPLVAVLDVMRGHKQNRMTPFDTNTVAQIIPAWVVNMHNPDDQVRGIVQQVAGTEITHAALLGYLLGRASLNSPTVFDFADIWALVQAGANVEGLACAPSAQPDSSKPMEGE